MSPVDFRNGIVPCMCNVTVNFKILQCGLPIVSNSNISCHYCLIFSVDFKMVICRLSNLRNGRVVEFMGRGSRLMEQLRLLLSGCGGVGGQGDLWSYNGGSGGD